MPIIITLAVVGFILLAALVVLNFVQEVGLKAWQQIVRKTMKIKKINLGVKLLYLLTVSMVRNAQKQSSHWSSRVLNWRPSWRYNKRVCNTVRTPTISVQFNWLNDTELIIIFTS